MDLQIFAAPRIILKPLVPTFPCFASLVLSLMEKVRITFLCAFFFFLFLVNGIQQFFFSLDLLAATYRLRVEYTGRGYHVHTWPLSVCSGAAFINPFGKLRC